MHSIGNIVNNIVINVWWQTLTGSLLVIIHVVKKYQITIFFFVFFSNHYLANLKHIILYVNYNSVQNVKSIKRERERSYTLNQWLICGVFFSLVWMHGQWNHEVKSEVAPSLLQIMTCLNTFASHLPWPWIWGQKVLVHTGECSHQNSQSWHQWIRAETTSWKPRKKWGVVDKHIFKLVGTVVFLSLSLVPVLSWFYSRGHLD